MDVARGREGTVPNSDPGSSTCRAATKKSEAALHLRLDLDQAGLGFWFGAAGAPARGMNRAGAEFVDEEACVDRAGDKVADLERAYNFFGSDPVEGAADGAAALGAVGSAAEDAWFDAAFEVGGIVGGHFCEEAIVGIFGWAKQGFSHPFGEEEFRELLVKHREFASEGFAVGGQKHFRALFADLGSVDADPDTVHFRARAPEGDIFFEVTGAFEHRACDDPVNVDFAAFDIFENAFVGGGLAADVVVLGEAVDRDGDADARQLHPFDGDGNDGAGDDEGENIHAAEDGENAAELFVADERFAADEGNVNRFVLADEIDDAIDESVAMEVVELAESGFAAEVRITVRVTARAGERAFASDFDGEHGHFAGEDIAPRGENFALGDARIGSGGRHSLL